MSRKQRTLISSFHIQIKSDQTLLKIGGTMHLGISFMHIGYLKHKRTTQAISPENIEAHEKFDRELTEDLMPFINSHYNVSDKRKDTAVAGLSMGGMESLLVGFSHLDRFNYIGSFSAAPSLDTFLLKLIKYSIKPKLILLCSGTSDSTVGDIPEGYHNILAENRVDHIWYLYPDGGHSYEVWLSGLINFLQRMKVRENWN